MPEQESKPQTQSDTPTQTEPPKVKSIDEAFTKGDKNDDLSKFWKELIKKQFVGDNNQIGENGDEVVDIVTEYQWVINKPIETGESNKYRDVPFLYAIEKYQQYGATATNLVNNWYSLKTSGDVIFYKVGQGVSGIFNKVKSGLSEAISSITGDGGIELNDTNVIGKTLTDVEKNKTSKITEGYSSLLDPYKHLYVLGETGKKYCFPFFGEGSASWSLNNDFSSDGSKGMLSKVLTEKVDDFAKGLVGIAGDIQELSNYLGTDKSVSMGGFNMYNIEKAKAFNFPSSGKTVSIRFPLFNTTKKDAWKDNYKFIVLFGFRNMLFRKDNVQYYPPLIYDVTIPGWGRMPLSFVKQFTVKPIGMIRPLAMENFIGKFKVEGGGEEGRSSLTVNVPEAWVVQIDFQSLIAESGNQYLSSMIDLPVYVSFSEYSAT